MIKNKAKAKLLRPPCLRASSWISWIRPCLGQCLFLRHSNHVLHASYSSLSHSESGISRGICGQLFSEQAVCKVMCIPKVFKY